MSEATRVDPAANAQLFILQDQVHEPMHDGFLWRTMMRRDAAAAAIPEWEQLRAIASQIKEHTLTHLDRYLEQFADNAEKRGAKVHWAVDAAEHNNIVYSMHEAYRRVRLDGTAYGCLMMGPSATADIESTLVHGAQGVRSLNVFFLARGKL